MLKRILTIFFGMVAGSFMALGLLHFVLGTGWVGGGREVQSSSRYYGEIMTLVQDRYVDEARVEPAELTRRAVAGLLQELDAHSRFLRASDYDHLQENLDSRFGGIGVQIEMKDGFVVVIAPMAGTPGFEAGILRGDRVMAVNDESMRGLSIHEVVERMRGVPGTEVKVALARGAEEELVDLTIVREIIRVESVPDVMMLDAVMGYVRISQFSEPTAGELHQAIERLLADGMQALVLDLRNNPGGLLSAAAAALEPFFEAGELMLYTEGRHESDRQEFRSTNHRSAWNWPIAVIVNAGSASAAEILAGSLQDAGKAVVVGERSFGKGSVQSVFRLRDGEALRLTTGRYFTSGGKTVHEVGVTPDLEVVMTPEEDAKLALQRGRRDLTDPLEFEGHFGFAPLEDVQLAAVREHLRLQLAPEDGP